MNILQRIIKKPGTISKFDGHISEPVQDVVFSEKDNPGEPINEDIDYDFLNPTNEAIMTNIPRNFFNISILDLSIFAYGYLLKAEQFVADAWDNISGIFRYRTEIKTAKAIAKAHKIKHKNFVQSQVKAMVPSIANFNINNTVWATGEVSGSVYQIRNAHTLIKNRNISRHWGSVKQQVIS